MRKRHSVTDLPKGLDTVYTPTGKVVAQDLYKVDERYTLK